MSDLVGDPEDRISHDADHFICTEMVHKYLAEEYFKKGLFSNSFEICLNISP